MKKFLFLLAFLSSLQFTKPPREGIRGQILWLRADQMSGPSKTIAPPLGVVREVLIYRATSLKDVEQNGYFFDKIGTEPIASTWSKDDGTFKINVPAGEYSVFIQESKGLFANTIGEDGCINCVAVKPKSYAWVPVTIDYDVPY